MKEAWLCKKRPALSCEEQCNTFGTRGQEATTWNHRCRSSESLVLCSITSVLLQIDKPVEVPSGFYMKFTSAKRFLNEE
eukprot:scaffold189323_cov10-Tisochrysis_lutea.AAC.1